jgi:O-6-methylguanine DNA methyltransferase
VLGLSPRQYADALRIERVKADLRAGRPIASALYGAGFGSTSRLYERAGAELGMTPGRYRKGGEGEEIRYAIIPSPLGHVMVAGTSAGICRVALGEGPHVLEADLRRELPRAVLKSGGPELEGWVRPLQEYMSGHSPLPDLPLDIQATAFQRRVWETLREIPEGTTRSYEEVAQEIGEPNATRAVAQACAKNPAAVVIPCHRVVRKDGELGGYRWGPEVKKSLLELERRLEVVLSADVVGYSRLMAQDPDATVRALSAQRKRIAVLIEARRGRVVDTAGDNILAVFPSATDAIRSAVMIQRVLERSNAELPTERRMELRIGIHVGELIIEGERVYGDGVNIAARLERLAEPGGLCISAAVQDLASSRLDLDLEDLGKQALHNIPVPVRAYRVRPS